MEFSVIFPYIRIICPILTKSPISHHHHPIALLSLVPGDHYSTFRSFFSFYTGGRTYSTCLSVFDEILFWAEARQPDFKPWHYYFLAL